MAAAADREIRRLTGLAADVDRAGAREYVQRQWERSLAGAAFSVAIADAGTDRGIGHIVLALEDLEESRGAFSVWVVREFRRRGAALAALRAMTKWAFSMLGLHRLEAPVAPSNRAGAALAGRAGFQREGVLRSWKTIDGGPTDMVMFSLLATDELTDG